MEVTFVELKNNFEKYLDMLDEEDLIITCNGKKIARLVRYEETEDYVIREGAVDYNYWGKEVSYEEFLELTEGNEKRYEYVDGKVYLLSSPTYNHQKIAGEIYTILSLWFRDKKCNLFFSPLDVRLFKKDNINVVQPDILVICDPENVKEDGKYHGTPTLLIEILSSSNRGHDVIKKLDLYRASGVKEYWIVNPFEHEIAVYLFEEKSIKKMKTYKNKETLESVVFEGLKISLGQVFFQ